MSDLQIFNYGEIPVRTVLLDGEPWWVLADVCRVLNIERADSTARRLDPDEKGVHLMDTPGGNQKMSIINESGLYKVILRSDKPEAKAFTRWVTHEVLPAIRKTGSYGVTITEVEKTAKSGFSKTALTPETLNFVQSLGKNSFSLVRPKVGGLKGAGGKEAEFQKICVPVLRHYRAGHQGTEYHLWGL